jgi:hypothetical protein
MARSQIHCETKKQEATSADDTSCTLYTYTSSQPLLTTIHIFIVWSDMICTYILIRIGMYIHIIRRIELLENYIHIYGYGIRRCVPHRKKHGTSDYRTNKELRLLQSTVCSYYSYIRQTRWQEEYEY